MLPDRDPEVTVEFSLLERMPFLQRVLINLKAGPGVAAGDAIAAADRISGALLPPYFSRVLSGPGRIDPGELHPWLMRALPSLAGAEDMAKLEQYTSPEAVKKALSDLYFRLQSPEGWAMKSLLREDPMGLSGIGFEKLRSLNFLKGMRIEENHFISADGRNLLIIAETPVPITDSKRASELVHRTEEILDKNVPKNMSATFLSGHAYTSANAAAVQRDLLVILSCGAAAIFILLLLFMWSWKAVFVYLVPASVVCIATAATALTYQTISALTLAFGSVLMGISDDYPIFTYFSLRDRGRFSGAEIKAVSRPVLFSGITTMATFSVLFFSGLPGQRQIAYFSIIGIIASLGLSLLVLPHLIRGMNRSEPALMDPWRKPGRSHRVSVIASWSVVMALSIWQSTHLSFNGDMRAVSMVPDSIRSTEKTLKETWGDFRDSAMALSEGATLEEALERNDRLYKHLQREIPSGRVISIAPVLPSDRTQQANRERWASFWTREQKERVKDLIVKEGNRIGFNPDAFAPFFDVLMEGGGRISAGGLRKAGLGDLIDFFILSEAGVYRILTLLPDSPDVEAFFSARNDELTATRFVSQRRFNERISKFMARSFGEYILMASFVMIVFLGILFHDVKKVVLALVPVATGLCFMFGIMGFTGIEFNLFNIIATILVIGLGADLGIFMVSRVSEGLDRNTARAVVLSGLTSLVGLGALMLARHPSLHSIGITVFLGMCGAIPAAVLVVPALLPVREKVSR